MVVLSAAGGYVAHEWRMAFQRRTSAHENIRQYLLKEEGVTAPLEFGPLYKQNETTWGITAEASISQCYWARIDRQGNIVEIHQTK